MLLSVIMLTVPRPAMGRLRDNSPPSPPHHRRLGREGLARRRDGACGSSSDVLPGTLHNVTYLQLCQSKFYRLIFPPAKKHVDK